MDQMDFGTLFRIFLTLLYFFSNVPGTHTDLLQIDPKRVLVEYGGSVSVNCSTNSTPVMLAWESPEGRFSKISNQIVTWTVNNLTEFGIHPVCYMVLNEEQYLTVADVTVYKRPDKVSIIVMNHSGLMIEGQKYDLNCDVQNVVPIELVSVNWYKGNTLLKNTTFSGKGDRPVNVSTTLMIKANRTDLVSQYRCEAVLNLGPEGPQSSPTVSSGPLSLNMQYPPTEILELKSRSVKLGETVVLRCFSSANPRPSYKWNYSNMPNVKIENSQEVSLLHITNATISNTGNYTCEASNFLDKNALTVRVEVNAGGTNMAPGLWSGWSFLFKFNLPETKTYPASWFSLSLCDLLIFTSILGVICDL